MQHNKATPILLACIGILVMLVVACNRCNNKRPTKDPQGQLPDSVKLPTYRPDELLIFFKHRPTQEEINAIKTEIKQANSSIDTGAIQQRRCSSCDDTYVELWKAPDIHIHADSKRAGTSTGNTNGVGEDALARYSENYVLDIPREEIQLDQKIPPYRQPMASGSGKDTVIIALLDTGFDTTQSQLRPYLWKNRQDPGGNGVDDDGNCLTDDVQGWNFVAGNANIQEDNPGRHGSSIGRFIINEFQQSGGNYLQLLVLKTHDGSGSGDLFNIICALNYAVAKGAHIINASWGFYSQYEKPHPFLDSMVNQVLRSKGILFVTAAGNKMDAEDARFTSNFPGLQPRKLDDHHFYPACLGGRKNNVLVATTNNDTMVSRTQNYSNVYVDLGVRADVEQDVYMKFKLPLTDFPSLLSGSSFATGIAAGKIGANCPVSLYKEDLHKTQFIESLGAAVQSATALSDKGQINLGRYIKHR
jgi:hypothetical protein